MKVRPKRYFPMSDWLEGLPQNHALDGARLLSIRAHVEARLPHVRSIIVARNGYIVFEMYRQGFGRDSVLNLASITKSVTALLAGAVISRGQLRLTDRIVEHFPDLIDLPDPRAASITVGHLLNMTAGFDWTDARVAQWRDRQDEPRFPLRHAMNAEPGTLFNYDTPASHLLSAVLARAAGQPLDALAEATLFKPLGITTYEWESDAQGYAYAGHGLHLRSRDALKLGLLVLRRGEWQGAQIVPPEWIDACTRTQSAGYPETFGTYGYLWWVQPVRGHTAAYAAGSGGQFLHVIADLDLLVLVTSNHDRLHAENKQIVRDFAVPAVLDA